MCVTLCHRRAIFFWNHEDCAGHLCPVVNEAHGACQSCRHYRGEICALTHATLPESGGCCHWNVEPVEDMVRVTPAMTAPLVGFFDTVRNVIPDIPHQVVGREWLIPLRCRQSLDELGIPYRATVQGLVVEPESLVLTVDEAIPDVLESFELPYQLRADGGCWIDPSELSLPETFGRAVEY